MSWSQQAPKFTPVLHPYSSFLFSCTLRRASPSAIHGCQQPAQERQGPAPSAGDGRWQHLPPIPSTDSAPQAPGWRRPCIGRIFENLNLADQVYKALVNAEPFRRL